MSHILGCFHSVDPPSLVEVVLRVISWPDPSFRQSSPEFPPDTVAFALTRDSTIATLHKKLKGSFTVNNACEYAYCGRILKPSEVIPDECFEVNQRQDEVSLVFRARITLVILSNKYEEGYVRPKEETVVVTMIHDTSQEEERLRLEREMLEKQLMEQHNGEIEPPMFDMKFELEQVECTPYFPALAAAGYGQEGSFVTLTEEDDLIAAGLHFPRGAVRRILALADNLRPQLPTRKVAPELVSQPSAVSSARQGTSRTSTQSGTANNTARSGGGGGAHHKQAASGGLSRSLWKTAVTNAAEMKPAVDQPPPPAVHSHAKTLPAKLQKKIHALQRSAKEWQKYELDDKALLSPPAPLSSELFAVRQLQPPQVPQMMNTGADSSLTLDELVDDDFLQAKSSLRPEDDDDDVDGSNDNSNVPHGEEKGSHGTHEGGTCCCAHHETNVQRRRRAIRAMVRRRLCAQLQARFEWLVGGADLVAFEDLFTALHDTLQAFRTEAQLQTKALGVAEDESDVDLARHADSMREYLQLHAALTLREWHALESVHADLCEQQPRDTRHHATWVSLVVPGALYSREKFVRAVLEYLDVHDPDFFVRPS